uniref:Uncharacterized protein n=1 Tax=Neobodo designis TaxID=312471 RepID=A0A7S1QB79_NEODS
MGCASSKDPPPPLDEAVVRRKYFATADPELHADCDFGEPESPLPPAGSDTAVTAHVVCDKNEGGVDSEEPSDLTKALARQRHVALARIRHGITDDIAQFPAQPPPRTAIASSAQRVRAWFRVNDALEWHAKHVGTASPQSITSVSGGGGGGAGDSGRSHDCQVPALTSPVSGGAVSSAHTSGRTGGSSAEPPPDVLPGAVPQGLNPVDAVCAVNGPMTSPTARLGNSHPTVSSLPTSTVGTPRSSAYSFGSPIGVRSRAGSVVSSADSWMQSHHTGGAAAAVRLTSRALYKHQVRLRQVGVPFAVDVRLDAPSFSSEDNDDDDDDDEDTPDLRR